MQKDVQRVPHCITSRAKAKLNASSYPGLKHIDCVCYEGILVLQGQVSGFFLKQLAQTLVAHIDGVRLVVNRIDVLFEHGPMPPRSAAPLPEPESIAQNQMPLHFSAQRHPHLPR